MWENILKKFHKVVDRVLSSLDPLSFPRNIIFKLNQSYIKHLGWNQHIKKKKIKHADLEKRQNCTLFSLGKCDSVHSIYHVTCMTLHYPNNWWNMINLLWQTQSLKLGHNRHYLIITSQQDDYLFVTQKHFRVKFEQCPYNLVKMLVPFKINIRSGIETAVKDALAKGCQACFKPIQIYNHKS